jgi:hypothetical protein
VKTRVDEFPVGNEQQIAYSPKSMVKSFIKLVAPTHVLRLMRATRDLLDQKIGRPYQVKQWKRELNTAHRCKLEGASIELPNFSNRLPNSEESH